MAGYIGTQAVSVNTTSATISDDLSVGDDLTVTDDATIGGTALVTGVLTTTAAAVFNAGFTSNADTNTFTSANATDPVLIIKNTTNDADSARIRFVKDKGAAGADDDKIGTIEFFSDNAAQEQTQFALIRAEVAISNDGAEGGKLRLQVATHDGEMQSGLILADGNVEDEIDVQIAKGGASLTTIAGNATVSGSTLKIVDTELSEVSDNFSINIQSGNNDFLVKSGGTTFASFKGADGSKNFGTFSNGSGGFNLFVGSANTGSFALRLDGVGTSASNVVQFSNGNGQVGTITVSGTATAYNTSSDYRLKENVVYDWDATTRLKQLKPARFNFIADADTTVDGFLAHEAQAVIPESVTGTKDAMRDEEYVVTAAVEEVTDADGNVTTEAADAVMRTRSVPDIQSIDQSKLVPLLVKTILELEARITALES